MSFFSLYLLQLLHFGCCLVEAIDHDDVDTNNVEYDGTEEGQRNPPVEVEMKDDEYYDDDDAGMNDNVEYGTSILIK